MSLNQCKRCGVIPKMHYFPYGETVFFVCQCAKAQYQGECAESDWNADNPLPTNSQQWCRDSDDVREIDELKKQRDEYDYVSRQYRKDWRASEEKANLLMAENQELKNERKKNMWSIPEQFSKIEKLEAELENKRQKIERQRAELQKLNDHFAIKCEKIAAMADVIKARNAKIAALEKRHIDSENECDRLGKKNDELRSDIIEAEERVRILSGQLAEEKGLNKAAHEYAELKRKELDLLEKIGLVDRIE